MYMGEYPNRINEQWMLAKKMGIIYPSEISPEEAKSQGFITKEQFLKIKNKLPIIQIDPITGEKKEISLWQERFTTRIVSPTLDIVGKPIEGILRFTRNTAFTLLGGIVLIGLGILYIGRKR